MTPALEPVRVLLATVVGDGLAMAVVWLAIAGAATAWDALSSRSRSRRP